MTEQTEMGSPTDALSVLGNEIRMSILRELAETNEALSFTELRERVGIRDSGRFNYHLTKLCAYFVRETDVGYELGHAGSRVISAAGYEKRVAEMDTDVVTEERCPVCGATECEKLFHVHLTPPWA
jgi:DNA-binding transcriptional ArsR family regulator